MIYKNLTFEQYIELEGINQSSLKTLDKGSKYFKYKQEDTETTKALEFGKLVDEYILTPKSFNEKYLIIEEQINKRTNKGKERLIDLAEESGKTIIIGNDADPLIGIKKSLYNHPIVSDFLRDFEPQISLDWIDEEYNIKCKARFDGVISMPDKIVIFDLKTAKSAEKIPFTYSMFEYKYHIQAAFYMDGLKKNLKEDKIIEYVLIPVEKKPPYLCAAYSLKFDSSVIGVGVTEYKNFLHKYKEEQKINKWDVNLNNNKIVSIDEYVPYNYINKLDSQI